MSLYFINEWFTFQNVIDKDTCNRIKNLGKGNWSTSIVNSRSGKDYTEEERLTGGNIGKDVGIENPDYRMSDIHWTDEQWVYDVVWPYLIKANTLAGWNLDISAGETLQLTRYKEGGYYNWHKDGLSDNLSAYDKPDNSFIHGKVRKISMTLLLDDNFKGGDLEFCSYSDGKTTITPIKAKAGDMIFFTSGMEHRVAPVTKGTRHSLVGWFVGPPIK